MRLLLIAVRLLIRLLVSGLLGVSTLRMVAHIDGHRLQQARVDLVQLGELARHLFGLAADDGALAHRAVIHLADAAYAGGDVLNGLHLGGDVLRLRFVDGVQLGDMLLKLFEYLLRSHTEEAACITHGGVIMSMLAQHALPQRKPEEWITDPGAGYSVRCDAEMWMRDKLVEAFDIVPEGYLDGVEEAED